MQSCTVCFKSRQWQSTKWVDYDTGARIWRCRNHPEWSPHYQTELPAQGYDVPPKLLYIDIETALMRVNLYDLYVPSKRISKDMIDRKRFVINWAAAWVDPKTYKIKGEIVRGVCTPKEARTQNDKRILKPIFDLMDESDVIAWHNGNSFDSKMLKWRFLKHGMGYPLASKQIDTFTLSGRTKPESRGLEYLSMEFGGKPKKGLDQHEWREIVEKGTPELLAKADRYCVGDVREGVRVLRHFALAEQQSGRVFFR